MKSSLPISKRASFSSTLNVLEQALQSRRQKGLPIVDLTISNPTHASIKYPGEIKQTLAEINPLCYDPSPHGSLKTREAIGKEIDIDASQIMLTASTSEAYSFLFKLFCDPHDVVLAPRPSYPLIEVIAKLEHVHILYYDLLYDGQWYIDYESIENQIDKARFIIAVSPNNPTGSYLSKKDKEKLLDYQLPLVVDEVFHAFPLETKEFPSSALHGHHDGLVISLGGLSKYLALPQMKLSWMAFSGNSNKVHAAITGMEHIADAFLSTSTISQLATPEWLQLGSSIRNMITQRTFTNLQSIDRLIENTSISRLRVEGGWYVVLQLPSTETEESWVLSILEQGIYVQPGWYYDFTREPFIVLSLLTEPKIFEPSFEKLVQFVLSMMGDAHSI